MLETWVYEPHDRRRVIKLLPSDFKFKFRPQTTLRFRSWGSTASLPLDSRVSDSVDLATQRAVVPRSARRVELQRAEPCEALQTYVAVGACGPAHSTSTTRTAIRAHLPPGSPTCSRNSAAARALCRPFPSPRPVWAATDPVWVQRTPCESLWRLAGKDQLLQAPTCLTWSCR